MRQEKERKGTQIGKEEVKLFLFSNDMILYLKDPKTSTIKFLNTFSKVAGYKINIRKSVVFVYINNEQTEKEIWKTISFTIASNNI
jgi:hypothetical protein